MQPLAGQRKQGGNRQGGGTLKRKVKGVKAGRGYDGRAAQGEVTLVAVAVHRDGTGVVDEKMIVAWKEENL